MKGLFENLPAFPVALPDDELRLLAMLPDHPTEQEVDESDHAACRRLERRGLVKVSRQKLDNVALRPTWFAGVMPCARVRMAVPA